MMFILLWGFILLIPAAAGDVAPPCDDFDTHGCVSNPSLCQDPVLSVATCPNTCHKCPVYCYNCNSVINATSCTNITTCPSDMRCMFKQVTSSADGHEEYTMQCVDKAVCDSKRSLDERNVQKFCCADNFCNTLPTLTTPVTMTTPAMVQSTISTARLVPNCNKDIIFIMEESNRVPSIEPNKQFMHAIVTGLDISPRASLVALVSHNDYYNLVGWPLNKYPTKTSLLQAIELTQWHPQRPEPDPLDGIRVYLWSVANGQQGNRPDKEDVVIIMTTVEIPEHYSPMFHVHSLERPYDLIARLQRQSNNVIWLGIGPGISDRTLSLVTKDSNHRFHLSSVDEMPNYAQRVANLICP